MPQLILAACLLLLLVGYAAGRRQGEREGRARGEGEALMTLRELAYERGACPLCGTRASNRNGGGTG